MDWALTKRQSAYGLKRLALTPHASCALTAKIISGRWGRPAHADLARLNEHVDAVGILLHRAELADLLVHGHPQVAAGEEALGEVILEII